MPPEQPLGYTSRMAAIFKHGIRQLDALAATEEGFEIVWLLGRSPFDSEFHFVQAIATLFGIQNIVERAKDSAAKPCYFFGESIFHKHKQLDAAIVEKPEGFVMCLNPYASRLVRFRKTTFFAFFNARATIDPFEEEKAGLGYVADCEVPRHGEKEVLAYVAEKYHLRNPMNLVFKRHVAYGVAR
jgi:hypothetical protein